MIEAISRDGGDIRTVTTTRAEPEYDLLCSDVTRPMDLALLEGRGGASGGLLFPGESDVEEAARVITAGRPAVQAASMRRQIEELLTIVVQGEKLAFKRITPWPSASPGAACGLLSCTRTWAASSARLADADRRRRPVGRRADRHARAGDADDSRIHLYPINPRYRESINFIPADKAVMYPGDMFLRRAGLRGVRHAHEREGLLLSLGYFSDEELQLRRERGHPLPPASLWVSSNMRRPFALVGNAIASMRTLRKRRLGAKVQAHLGRDSFPGPAAGVHRQHSAGGLLQFLGGDRRHQERHQRPVRLGIPPDLLVHLACQAEYGTGVRAGSLDQATEQKGRLGRGR